MSPSPLSDGLLDMNRIRLTGLALGTALSLGALPSVGPASAARPQPGAYFGFPGDYARASFVDSVDVTKLRVSRSGRSFAPTTLRICQTGVRVSSRSGRAAAVPIRPDGRFAVGGSDGVYRYRVRGRFMAFNEARISVSGRGRFCRRGRIVLYRNGVPPFRGCASQPAVTLFSSPTGRVLEQLKGGPRGRGFRAHAYGCLFASPSTRIDLGENVDPDATLEEFRSAGPMLAIIRGGCIGACQFIQRYLEVRDLRDGSIVSRPDIPFWSLLRDFALKDNGSAAWTLERIALGPNGFPIGFGTGPPVIEARELWALDSHGQRLLDSDLELVVDSLELNGSTLYWLDGTTARSSTLD